MNDKSRFDEALLYIENQLENILANIPRKNMETAVQLFLRARRIFVYGTGRSGLVGKAFAIRLVHLGFQTFVIGETITAPVQKNDLVVLISGTGETIPVTMTAEIARRLGAKIVSITANPESHTARFADVVIILNTTECNAQLAPLGTLFESSAWVFLDGLVAELMGLTGEDEESMKERHATLE
jgi:6-phospho-3-hexuloisomerase